jgi:hypothetical protein
MARFSDQMGELKESIGYAVLPVMTALANVALTQLVPALEAGIGVVTRIGAAVLDELKEPLSNIVDTAGRVVEVFSHLGDVFADPAVAIQEGIGLTGAWGQALTDVIVFIRDDAIPTLQNVGTGIGIVAGQVVAIVTAIVEWVTNTGLLNTALIGLQTIWVGLQAAAAALWPLLKQVADFMVENKIAAYALVAVFGAMVVAMAPIPIAIAGIILAVGLLREHWDDIKAKAIEVWNSIPGPIKAALDAILCERQARGSPA